MALVNTIVFRRVARVTESAYYLHDFRPSVCQHVSARLPLDAFPWNFMLATLMKTCRENLYLVTIAQKYWALYVKILARFFVAGYKNS